MWRRGRRCPGERGTLEVVAAVAGIRNSGECVGAASSGAADRGLRSEVAGSALPDRGSGVGAVVAASGDSGFGRSEATRDGSPRQRRVIPTSVAPITFFVREEADWMALRRNPHLCENRADNGSEPHSDERTRAESRGADWCLSFCGSAGPRSLPTLCAGRAS